MKGISARAMVIVALMTTLFVTQPARADEELHAKVVEAIELFKSTDPSLSEFFADAYGYVVFPNIVKGGLGLGGARGNGEVYERDRKVGDAVLTQFTIGAQIGGQAYAEVIFFEDESALDNFKDSKMEFTAQASAIAASAGASIDAPYEHGVMVVTMGKKGLMAEAAVGGQKFKFKADK